MLEVTLRSVLAQRGVDVRVVVVDDGGSDDTARRLADRWRPKVDVVRHEASLGVSRARNRGLAEVTSPWVAFLDDDDLWAPDKLQRQLDALHRRPECRWACSCAANFYSDGTIYGLHRPPPADDVATSVLLTNNIPGGGSGVLVDTELARAVGGFEPSLSNLADWDCWIRLAQLAPMASVATADVGYRRHRSSLGHDVARSEHEIELVLQRHGELYRRAGISFDHLPWLWYLEKLTYSSGDWFGGVRRSASLASRRHQPGAAVEPLRQLVPERIRRRRQERRVVKADPGAYAYAQAWIGSLLHDAEGGGEPSLRAILAR